MTFWILRNFRKNAKNREISREKPMEMEKGVVDSIDAEEIIKSYERHKQRKKAWIVVLCVILVLVLGCGGICTAAMLRETVLGNTSVMGVDMSGLTLAQAQEKWEQAEPCRHVSLDLLCRGTGPDGAETTEKIGEVTLEEMGISVEAKEAARAAWNAGHGGNLLENGWALVYSWWKSVDVMPRLDVDKTVMSRRAADLAEELNCTVVDGAWRLAEDGLYLTKPQDGRKISAAVLCRELEDHAGRGDLGGVECQFDQVQAQTLDIAALHQELAGSVKSALYDRTTGEAGESRIGVAFNVADMEAELEAAVPGQEFLTSAKVEYPKVSHEELTECMFRDVLGTYTTYVSGTWGRRTNVRLAAEKINGRVYNPGEEFWYNATVGQRTAERGFQPAPAYFKGQTVDEIGGGICQVSSTLYYATLLGDLQIVQRYAHQFAPAYIAFGCDATVSWNGPDYAFRNNTDYPIKIVTVYSDDNNLTCTIYGTKTDDHTVKMESYTRSVESWQTWYKADAGVPLGEQVVEQTPYTGYYVEAYRCRYDGEGNLIERVFENKSDYDKRDKVILVNPMDGALTHNPVIE